MAHDSASKDKHCLYRYTHSFLAPRFNVARIQGCQGQGIAELGPLNKTPGSRLHLRGYPSSTSDSKPDSLSGVCYSLYYRLGTAHLYPATSLPSTGRGKTCAGSLWGGAGRSIARPRLALHPIPSTARIPTRVAFGKVWHPPNDTIARCGCQSRLEQPGHSEQDVAVARTYQRSCPSTSVCDDSSRSR